MKVVERIFKQRIRQQIDIHDMQFGVMKGNGTTDDILVDKKYSALSLLNHGKTPFATA